MKVFLYIEDNPNDRELFALTLRRADPNAVLRSVPNAIQAIAYLEGRDGFADRHLSPLPNLIVLDLAMPFMDPMQFLFWLKGSAYKDIPAVVLSGSANRLEMERAHASGALMTFPKGIGLDQLRTSIESMLAISPRTNGVGLPVSNPIPDYALDRAAASQAP